MHKTAVATMPNYNINMFTSVNYVECPRTWLFHAWHNMRRVHSTCGITRDVCLFHAMGNVSHGNTLQDLSCSCCVITHFHVCKNEVILSDTVYIKDFPDV